ncbi:SPRY domain-containing protein 3-like [Haliotis asinina]|uniref:SPRY domain-containing protein 3-like n=1 Tax=Haliotis asinina TaxID=109174 RepID=UPI003531F2BB
MMEAFLRNQILNVCRVRHHQRLRDAHLPVRRREPRYDRLGVEGEIISFMPNDGNKVGLYIAACPISPEDNYFEIEIIDTGLFGNIGVGLVPCRYTLDAQPGWKPFSVGYHADDGKLYKACGFGKAFGPKCHVGDRIGCGIKYSISDIESGSPLTAKVFFTRNGKELGTVAVPVPPGGLYPAVGLHSEGEEVKLTLDSEWTSEECMLMAVDSGEEEWTRLHDIKLNGTILEYGGRGKCINDVGLAQARCPLDTTFHYFELEIVDPGENCYIAIGVARRNYPRHRHPGWNRGSIAYHADDGKIFVGSGIGDPFGPRCHKGDIMGCGIYFPNDYDSEADSDLSPEDPEDDVLLENDELSSDSEEEEEEGWARHPEDVGTKVQVFFTRNGKMVGKRQVAIPRGGFYPTIGMLSSCEKVRVDLRPLTG